MMRGIHFTALWLVLAAPACAAQEVGAIDLRAQTEADRTSERAKLRDPDCHIISQTSADGSVIRQEPEELQLEVVSVTPGKSDHETFIDITALITNVGKNAVTLPWSDNLDATLTPPATLAEGYFAGRFSAELSSELAEAELLLNATLYGAEPHAWSGVELHPGNSVSVQVRAVLHCGGDCVALLLTKGSALRLEYSEQKFSASVEGCAVTYAHYDSRELKAHPIEIPRSKAKRLVHE
jgi:hypothetical protein